MRHRIRSATKTRTEPTGQSCITGKIGWELTERCLPLTDIRTTRIRGSSLEGAVRDFGGLALAGWNSGAMRSSEDRISRRKLPLDRRKRSLTKSVAAWTSAGTTRGGRVSGDMIGSHYFSTYQFSPKISTGFVFKF